MIEKPKIGILHHRPNTKIRHSKEARDYHLVYISMPDGTYPFLFTDADIIKALVRAKRNPEDTKL